MPSSEDLRPCTDCGKPVLWGTWPPHCGERAVARGELIGWQWRRAGEPWPEKMLNFEPALTAPDTEKRALYAGPTVAYGVAPSQAPTVLRGYEAVPLEGGGNVLRPTTLELPATRVNASDKPVTGDAPNCPYRADGRNGAAK